MKYFIDDNFRIEGKRQQRRKVYIDHIDDNNEIKKNKNGQYVSFVTVYDKNGIGYDVPKKEIYDTDNSYDFKSGIFFSHIVFKIRRSSGITERFVVVSDKSFNDIRNLTEEFINSNITAINNGDIIICELTRYTTGNFRTSYFLPSPLDLYYFENNLYEVLRNSIKTGFAIKKYGYATLKNENSNNVFRNNYALIKISEHFIR